MRKKQKIIILLLLIIGEIIATSFLYKTTKKEDTFLENMTLKESVDNKNFAIFIQKEKGSSEYIPYTESTKWPTDYDFNSTLSNCISGNGTKVENILSFDASEKRVYVKNAKEAVYCNIYFDIPNPIPLPTCHFEIITAGTAAGVKLVPENADSWYLSQSQTSIPEYKTTEIVSNLTTGKYYGYVKNATGTGTCVLDAYQANEKKCTATAEEGERYQMCIYETETCDNNAHYSSNRRYAVGPDPSCHESGWYVNCTESNKNWTKEHCYCYYESQKYYKCSDGKDYSSETDCTSKSCGVEECQSGYETFKLNENYVYCHKTIA